MQLLVHPFFDSETRSFSYVILNPQTRSSAIIDPVCAWKEARTNSADAILEFVRANDLLVEWILQTHAHVDHFSAARYLKGHLVCAQTAISARVLEARQLHMTVATDGCQFDRLLADGERIRLGHTCGRVMHTPGHTTADATYVFEDKAFVGDTLFTPEPGAPRCDFTDGNARSLRQSLDRIYALPDSTKLFVCHDYGPGARYLTTVAEQKRAKFNVAQELPREPFPRSARISP